MGTPSEGWFAGRRNKDKLAQGDLSCPRVGSNYCHHAGIVRLQRHQLRGVALNADNENSILTCLTGQATVFPKRDLLDSHSFNTAWVSLQLIYIKYQHISLHLWHSLVLSQHSKNSKPLTSIKQKLGTGSSPSAHHPVPIAPVALPGLTKNFPSNSYASNLCVPPHNSTSTSICRAAINKLSASPGGIIVWPCVKPIRREP